MRPARRQKQLVRMTRRLTHLIVVVASLASAFALVALFPLWFSYAFDRPGPLTAPRRVLLTRDLTVEQIGHLLEQQHVVSSGWVFSLGTWLSGNASSLKPGEYEFGTAFSPRAAMRLITSGKRIVHTLTVPAGTTSVQIVKQIKATPGLEGPIAGVPAEGSLLPETYQYFWGDRRQDLIERMKHALDETVAVLWDRRAPDLPLAKPRDALILASIIARETQVPKERRLVASVLINRLKRGMKLQSDVTVAYGIAHADHLANDVLPRPLKRGDLQRPTPYNTYLIDGLPPTPICNPGKEAIEATLHPAKTKYLFFTGLGTTKGSVFARTAAQHARNVARLHAAQADTGTGAAQPSDAGENEAMAPTEDAGR